MSNGKELRAANMLRVAGAASRQQHARAIRPRVIGYGEFTPEISRPTGPSVPAASASMMR
jgi:hypothetical protein